MAGHTREPWHIETFQGDDSPIVCASWGQEDPIINEFSELGEPYANARRVVACVNALAGIPTEDLEAIAERQQQESMTGGPLRSMLRVAARRARFSVRPKKDGLHDSGYRFIKLIGVRGEVRDELRQWSDHAVFNGPETLTCGMLDGHWWSRPLTTLDLPSQAFWTRMRADGWEMVALGYGPGPTDWTQLWERKTPPP